MERIVFTASVVPGSHRGQGLGTPTLNLRLSEVPGDLQEGIYVCHVFLGKRQTTSLRSSSFAGQANDKLPAVLHYGPRPVFNDTPSCEVHVLDELITDPPTHITVTILERLRDVQNFSSPEALQEQIATDIAEARAILALP